MLREIEHQLRVLAWMRTEDATKRPEFQQHYPERLPLTTSERAEYAEKNRPEYDSMSLDEAAEFLGWKRPDPKEA